MASKDKSTKTRTNQAEETLDIVDDGIDAQTSASTDAVDIPEEVDVEVVEPDTETDIDDDMAAASGDADNGTLGGPGGESGEQGEAKGFSPGIVFLAALALTGVAATGLWALKSGKGETNPVAGSSTVTTEVSKATEATGAPEEQSTTTSPKAVTATIATPKDNTTTDMPIKDGRTKVANALDSDAKTQASKIDTDKIPESRKTVLPVAAAVSDGDPGENSAGANGDLQQAAKQAAAELSEEISATKAAAEDAAAPILAPDGAPSEPPVVEIQKEGEVKQNVKQAANENTDNETVGNENTANETVVSEKAANGAADVEDLANEEPLLERVVNEQAAVSENVVSEIVDPAAQSADLFAAEPANQETPADQLGVDPIAAVEALKQSAADQEQAAQGIARDANATDASATDINAGTEQEEVSGEIESVDAEAIVAQESQDNTQDAPNSERIEGESGQGDTAESNVAAAPANGDNIDRSESPAETAQDNGVTSVIPSAGDVVANDVIDGPPSVGDDQAAIATADAEAKLLADNAAIAAQSALEVEEKFAGEIAALEESFEQRTQRIAEALERERERAALQAEEISTLKREYNEAIAANAERSSNEIDALRNRIDELLEQEAEKKDSTEQQTRALLAIIALQRQFDQGAPYQRELGVLKMAMPSGANGIDFAILDQASQKGVPTIATLKTRFPKAIRSTIASNRSGAKGPIGHIMRNLQSLVSVRPASPQNGDDIPAIISRAEDYLERDDLGKVVSELDALGAAASPSMTTWLESAKMRNAASALVNQLNDQLLAGVNN